MAEAPKDGDKVAAVPEEIDPIKKAKKDEKAAIKAAKKAKAAEKAAKAAEALKNKGPTDGKKDKKAAAQDARALEAAAVQGLIDVANATPKGKKKTYGTLDEMAKGYHPKLVEAATYSWWEESGYFQPSSDPNAEKFVIVMPPPNVTGSLHLGHALTVSIQDALIRWHRMCGHRVLWVPGLDHASIATQSIVEKDLAKKGLKREELGREAFLSKVHEWVATYGGRIHLQLRRLGSSCDWTRQAYTMSEPLSAAVKEAFLRMHRDGLIYRDVRLVNWDSVLKTAVSDSEVEYQDIAPYTKLKVPGYDQTVEFGVLTSFAYKLSEPVTGGDGKLIEEIVIATTRPETMIGDTGIAVHPDDPRYKAVIGKTVVHPLDGRKIPIVADAELVEMDFGTGAVKITPAHDPNDFETGKRHKLEFINILTDDGKINHRGGEKFEGMPRFKARVEVVKYLEEEGYFRGTEGNTMRLGTCSRSGDVIEPVIKPQWWVSCKSMGEAATKAVKDGDIRILPSPKTFLEIPAYYYTLEGDPPAAAGSPGERTEQWVVAPDEGSCPEAGGRETPWRQDRDA